MGTEPPVKTILAAGLFIPACSLNTWKRRMGEHAEVLDKNIFANSRTLYALAAAVQGYLLEKYGRDTVIHFIGHSVMGLVGQILVQDMPKLWATLIAPAPPRGVRFKTSWPRMDWSGLVKRRTLKKKLTPSPIEMRTLMTDLIPEDQRGWYDAPPGEPADWVWDIILAKVEVNNLGNRVRIITGRKDTMISHETGLRIAEKHGCAIWTHDGGHLPWLEPVAAKVFNKIQDHWGDFWFLQN